MPPPTSPEIYRFSSVSTLHSVGEVAKAYAEQKLHRKASREEIQSIIKQIVKDTNAAINEGIIHHKLYDPTKIGKDQTTGQWFKKRDDSDIDLTTFGDEIVIPEDLKIFPTKIADNFLKKNTAINDPTLEIKKKLNANTGNRVSNSAYFKEQFTNVAKKVDASPKRQENFGQAGHLFGSVAGSGINLFHGIYSYDNSKDWNSKENIKADCYMIAGSVGALNGIICSLEDSPKRDFFRAFNELGQDINKSKSGKISEADRLKFFKKIDDLIIKIESPTTREKLSYWMGRKNETYFWNVNSGHKDMFNGIAELFKGCASLGLSAAEIVKSSFNENYEFQPEACEQAIYKSSPGLAKGAISLTFGTKAYLVYNSYEKAYKVQAQMVNNLFEEMSPQKIAALSNKNVELKNELQILNKKINGSVTEIKKLNGKKSQLMPAVYNYKLNELKSTLAQLNKQKKQLAFSLNEIKNTTSSIVAQSKKISEVQNNVKILRGEADVNAAKYLKKAFIGAELVNGATNLITIQENINILEQKKVNGQLNEHDYQVLQIAGKMKMATEVASTTASVVLLSGKVSNPVGWGVALADFCAQSVMPKQSEVDRACRLSGLDPNFNPYALDNHSPLEFSAACITVNTLRDVLTYSLDVSNFESVQYYKDYQKMADRYFDVTWKVIKDGNANSFESEEYKLKWKQTVAESRALQNTVDKPQYIEVGNKKIKVESMSRESTQVIKIALPQRIHEE